MYIMALLYENGYIHIYVINDSEVVNKGIIQHGQANKERKAKIGSIALYD